MIMKRNIAIYIVLCFVTCGVFPLIWTYFLAEDTNKLTGEANATSGGMVVLFSILTCGIYQLYWMYRQGERIDQVKTDAGTPSSNSGIVYLLLSLFGFGIVSYALMQNELNKFGQ